MEYENMKENSMEKDSAASGVWQNAEEKRRPGEQFFFQEMDNFRELGGYTGRNGRHVKYGVFYRSPALANLRTEEDRNRFLELGIKTVFDFRSEKERESAPDPKFDGIRYFALNAITEKDGSEVNFDLEAIAKSEEGMARVLEGVHESYGRLPFSNDAYRALFQAIVSDETPILFHCTAGKDRTGVAAALILTMLGVSREDVIKDYLLTNEYRSRGRQDLAKLFMKMGVDEENAVRISNIAAGVKAESLISSLDAIEERYPSFEKYLETEYGIGAEELETIRNRYLE